MEIISEELKKGSTLPKIAKGISGNVQLPPFKYLKI
jgi:hypothetical protein